jgi:hypothetical protein
METGAAPNETTRCRPPRSSPVLARLCAGRWCLARPPHGAQCHCKWQQQRTSGEGVRGTDASLKPERPKQTAGGDAVRDSEKSSDPAHSTSRPPNTRRAGNSAACCTGRQHTSQLAHQGCIGTTAARQARPGPVGPGRPCARAQARAPQIPARPSESSAAARGRSGCVGAAARPRCGAGRGRGQRRPDGPGRSECRHPAVCALHGGGARAQGAWRGLWRAGGRACGPVRLTRNAQTARRAAEQPGPAPAVGPK